MAIAATAQPVLSIKQHKYCNAQSFSREKSNIFQMGYFFIQTAFHFAGDSSFSLLVQLWFPCKHNALGNNLLQQIPFINKLKLCLKEHQDSYQKREQGDVNEWGRTSGKRKHSVLKLMQKETKL